ncbi:MAG: hypothetical protein A3G81_02615 [Betaproteobacteria bacterium RIFCSPLOWO2_12_FULL_65_14]|nr:MAG: hypothetical protein A3G81_02615 [Betaproteobacteria bacterium RIFCSPLOWO2_12_FULL_65_14]
MRDYQYVWLFWSSAFLVPWAVIYLLSPALRRHMLRVSAATSLLGLTEPIFVPRYWNPPSLFDLAQRTGFDIESLIFCFALGGIGAVLYNALAKRELRPVPEAERHSARHRFHGPALATPFVAFPLLYALPWNPIYPGIAALAIGAASNVLCRPELGRKTLLGGALFLALYAIFMALLVLFAPGYIEQVWSLADLSGLLLAGIPLEELGFGFAFGTYWAGLYEHFTWRATSPRTTSAFASDGGHHG